MAVGRRGTSLVPFTKGYVVKGLFMGLFIATFYTVDSVIQDGWTSRTIIIDVAYAVFMVVVWTWSPWHEDNRLERDLRASRRYARARPRAKAR